MFDDKFHIYRQIHAYASLINFAWLNNFLLNSVIKFVDVVQQIPISLVCDLDVLWIPNESEGAKALWVNIVCTILKLNGIFSDNHH